MGYLLVFCRMIYPIILHSEVISYFTRSYMVVDICQEHTQNYHQKIYKESQRKTKIPFSHKQQLI